MTLIIISADDEQSKSKKWVKHIFRQIEYTEKNT